MPDFNVRSDAVNVEQIMDQIRARIREKRGVDYTEQQIRDLAAVKLEKFLDPKGVRSDLLDEFRKAQPAYEPPDLPNFAFEDQTLFESHRAPIRWIRKLLLPLLKLLFNPNPLIQALHIQSHLNTMNAEREARRESERRAKDQLYYELIHNLVVETTRMGIEVKNLKMRLESVSSRLEFNERRARALESAVVYKPSPTEEPPPQRASPPPAQQQRYSPPPRQQHAPTPPPPAPVPAAVEPTPAVVASASAQAANGSSTPGEGPGQRSRRRRRRRGRRGGGAAATLLGGAEAGTDPSAPTDATDQIGAMDPMDDDGAPESEESHPVAADNVEPALGTARQRPDPIEPAPPAATAPAPIDDVPAGRSEPDASASPNTATGDVDPDSK
jgi:hypothetical protein